MAFQPLDLGALGKFFSNIPLHRALKLMIAKKRNAQQYHKEKDKGLVAEKKSLTKR